MLSEGRQAVGFASGQLKWLRRLADSRTDLTRLECEQHRIDELQAAVQHQPDELRRQGEQFISAVTFLACMQMQKKKPTIDGLEAALQQKPDELRAQG